MRYNKRFCVRNRTCGGIKVHTFHINYYTIYK